MSVVINTNNTVLPTGPECRCPFVDLVIMLKQKVATVPSSSLLAIRDEMSSIEESFGVGTEFNHLCWSFSNARPSMVDSAILKKDDRLDLR